MNNSVRTTKKVVLSVGVILTFAAYSVVLRGQRSAPIVAPPSLRSSGNQSTPTNTSNSGNSTTTAQYKDGSYTGSTANAYYGNVQVQVTVSGGKITNVQFLQYPNDNPNSQYINSQATPYLRQEAIQAQSASVNVVTGATFTSQAFIQSLSSALSQAKA